MRTTHPADPPLRREIFSKDPRLVGVGVGYLEATGTNEVLAIAGNP